jgi:hypothetical protein
MSMRMPARRLHAKQKKRKAYMNQESLTFTNLMMNFQTMFGEWYNLKDENL